MSIAKRIFVCSRLRSGVDTNGRTRSFEYNLQRARDLCRDISLRGHAPFASHLLYTQFLNDEVPSERAIAMVAAQRFLTICDEVWVDGIGGRSSGMVSEVAFAEGAGIPVIVPSWAPWS